MLLHVNVLQSGGTDGNSHENVGKNADTDYKPEAEREGVVMDRKKTTEFLGNLLVSDRFGGMGKYWAKEVSIDPWAAKGKPKRVDYMQFVPAGQCSVSDIEKGIFVCYEICTIGISLHISAISCISSTLLLVNSMPLSSCVTGSSKSSQIKSLISTQ